MLNRIYLDSLCKEHGVPGHVKNELEMTARKMQYFSKQSHVSDTETSRSKALLKVEQLASKLEKAIHDLNDSDLCALEVDYFAAQYRNLSKFHECESIDRHCRELNNFEDSETSEDDETPEEELKHRRESDRFFAEHSLLSIEIPAIKAAARTARAQLSNAGKPGRPLTVVHEARWFFSIFNSLAEADIAPSATSPFNEFCAAIFEAAGLEVPERAFNHFMRDIRPVLKAESNLS